MSLSHAHRAAWRAGILAACLAAAACGEPAPPAPAFRLIGFRQAGETRVSLDEELVLHFSSEIERASVTSESVRIVDRQGHRARGTFRVERTSLHFEPDLPRSIDLGDAGLLPGTDYAVELLGFPRPDGLRSATGELLEATALLPFRTTDGTGPSPLFVDLFPPAPFPLTRPLDAGGSTPIGPLEPLVLICGEAIDPRSLELERFELFAGSNLGPDAGVPLALRLTENRRDLARLELTPRAGRTGVRAPLALGTHFLVRAHAGLEDLAGRRIETLWKGALKIEVAPDSFELEADFAGPFRRSLLAAEFDGTLSLRVGGNRPTLEYPRAAGDGSAGDVVLSAWGGENDVHSTRLTVPARAEVDLGSAPGLIVLRSQGTIDIKGRVRRSGRDGEIPPFLGATTRFTPTGEDLSGFLEDAREGLVPWTVLVAGGDVRISGEVEATGPLMIVAGGSIFVDGRIAASEIWRSHRGGENLVRVRELPLRIDPPLVNELARPLRWALLSAPLRAPRPSPRWGLIRLEGERGGGDIECQYLGRRPGGPGGEEELVYGPVPDLELLAGCPVVEVLAVLSMPAGTGEPWSPPRLDSLRIAGQAGSLARPAEERLPR
jgi:hypothetical protein